jgi:hypothetical protein
VYVVSGLNFKCSPLFKATPNKLPAAITVYWGASSAKYFSEVSALPQAYISSKKIRLSSSKTDSPAITDSSLTIR